MEEKNIHPTILDEDEAMPTAATAPTGPVGELPDKLRAQLRAAWDKMVIADSEYLDPSEPYEPPEFALSKDGIGFMTFGDFHFQTGQPGNGKTFTFTCLMAAILSGSFGPIKYEGKKRPKPKILYIDTEQSKGNSQLVLRRVYHMVGWPQGSQQDQFRVLMLRETARPEDRWAKSIRAMYDIRPDFVFLDGMLDVVEDMNKNDECNLLISEALACSSLFNLCMIGINHENPVSPKVAMEGATKPAGHLGSYCQRKAAAGIGTVKTIEGTNVTFNVIQKKARNKDFFDWRYKVNDEDVVMADGRSYQIGIPEAIMEPKDEDVKEDEDKNSYDDDSVRNMTVNCMTMGETISFTVLRERIKDRYGIGSGKAKEVINRATLIKAIYCASGKYTLCAPNLMDDSRSDDPF